MWNGTQGKDGANEISSRLFDWLISMDNTNEYEIINLFLDNCAGQHKNKILFSMISYFLEAKATSIKQICIIFLLKGHTYSS